MTRAEQQQADIEAVLGDKYHVLCRVGGGGMAQVLLARHRLHGGLFAVKILADHLAQDPNIVARFKQEATTAASLSGHPNIVPIFDIGEGHGLHYLVMQFVCGEDLSSYIRREGRLSPSAAASVIAQAAEALAWAETRRVVHRDLKPANIHLDTAGRIKILDFGISKITDIADGLTRPGEALGTPFYMSPEQIRGEGCDVRSDLYSLGVVFFELLTAHRPFENESATAIQMAHLSTPAPSVLSHDATLPPMCDHIIQKLLRKDRTERYSSAQELLAELHANGASSGPSSLRPQVDASLAEKINEAPTPGGCVSETRANVPAPGARTIEESLPVTGTHQPAVAAASVITEAEQTPRSKWVLVGLGSAGVLLVALVGLLATYRSQEKHTSKTAVAYVQPAPTISDERGTMLLVPSGDFLYGSAAADSPNPQQRIALAAFYIDATEVSNAQYRSFAAATGRPLTPQMQSAASDDPVSNISQLDAAAYAAWAGKRLPTEQEWEKAARGTDGRPFPWGTQPWVEGVPDHLQPVTSFPERRSPVGAFNMAGNVWEWTSSTYTPNAAELTDMERTLHTASFSNVWPRIKGGSFSPGGSRGFSVYLRRGFPADQQSALIGFRCAKSVPDAQSLGAR
ncbi:MAG: protein kinase domain-containing protein [Janthinobacterium lividum]